MQDVLKYPFEPPTRSITTLDYRWKAENLIKSSPYLWVIGAIIFQVNALARILLNL